jgi:hypothetical protein
MNMLGPIPTNSSPPVCHQKCLHFAGLFIACISNTYIHTASKANEDAGGNKGMENKASDTDRQEILLRI